MKISPIRALIVDDSAVIRGLMRRALETDGQIEVAGTAMHGQAALSWLRRNRVDVVLLDVEMPVMDGLETLIHLQKEFGNVPVLMASSLTREGAETTIKAMALGAAGCIAKPQASNAVESTEILVNELVPLVKAVTRKPGRRSPSQTGLRQRESAIRKPANGPLMKPRIVVIGTSTGGPRALTQVLTALPRDFPLPILIVQHMPPMFTPMLAKHLQADTGRPCAEAENNTPIKPNRTYIAPGDYHVTVKRIDTQVVTLLNQEPQEHFCRPSVNPLFRSTAATYGKSALGIILTGMGEDGIEGSRDLVASGGYLISQDEETSVVWGMPAAVDREGLSHEVLPLQEIGPRIDRLCSLEVSAR